MHICMYMYTYINIYIYTYAHLFLYIHPSINLCSNYCITSKGGEILGVLLVHIFTREAHLILMSAMTHSLQ